ncbi:MAG: hypothetical protein IT424_03195 [Pirellulales bacterium]|nr:hypothetical protein [Pirellulales bacterium]
MLRSSALKDPLFDEPLVHDWSADGYRLYGAGPNRFDDEGRSAKSQGGDDLGIIVVPPQK